MDNLRYVGPVPSGNQELVNQSHLSGILGGTLTRPDVDTILNDGLSEYATDSYVDTRDGLLATIEYIENQDIATRLAKANLNKPGYPFTLDTNGKVPPNLITAAASAQKYPNTSVVSLSGSASTTNETTIGNVISVPAPGFPYRLLVTGSVHARVSSDDGQFPRIVVARADGWTAGVGYGLAEGYSAPTSGSVSSRMYLNTNFTTPSNATWVPLPQWTAVTTGGYTSVVAASALQVGATMAGATLTATVPFAGAVAPETGATASQIRIFNLTTQTAIALSPPISGASGTCTVTATANITSGHLIQVQVITANTGSLYNASYNPGTLATWVAGQNSVLTITPPLSSNNCSGEIPIIPQISTQTTLPGSASTHVSVRLQNLAGVSAVSTVANYTPYLWVIPVPA